MKRALIIIISALTVVFSSFGQAESDTLKYPEYMASQSLPLLSIRTEGLQPILSKQKDSALVAKMNVTIPKDYTSFNRKEPEPLSGIALTIRGRGNATWQGRMKPYKIKLDKKQELAGLPEHKHFALLPHAGYLNYMSGWGGLEVARMFAGWWVPRVEPVELAVNGEYRGRYYLTESVKISRNRLNIFEQPDLCVDPDTIPYGWLVEIDNHPDSATSFTIEEYPDMDLTVTYHVPELLSRPQRQWVENEFIRINEAIYRGDDSWTELIDPVSAARYFIIRELFWDPDGYSGSMYLHRDMGPDARWHFGPMWDIAGTHKDKDSWVHESNRHYDTHWFPKLLESAAFRSELETQFAELYARKAEIPAIMERITRFCYMSHYQNYFRWGYPTVSLTIVNDGEHYGRVLTRNLKWMNNAIAELCGLNAPGLAPMLQIEGAMVRLPATAAKEITVRVLTPAGKTAAAFTLRPGGIHRLDYLTPGVYVLSAKGLAPVKILL
ncbi:MAG: CotH kinase family protein [Muribaculaceae bacterium]|nr:CotH kinase family protein [Muribaculaceae bacterium]